MYKRTARTIVAGALWLLGLSLPNEAAAQRNAAEFRQMKLACIRSGGRPSGEIWNDWDARGLCICPKDSPSRVGSGRVTCDHSSFLSAQGSTAQESIILNATAALVKWLIFAGTSAPQSATADAERQQAELLGDLEVRVRKRRAELEQIEAQRKQRLHELLRGKSDAPKADAALSIRNARTDTNSSSRSGKNLIGSRLSLTASEQAASGGDCQSYGIAGLPGLYLKDCEIGTTRSTTLVGEGDPVALAKGAQTLSAIERAAVEELAITTASKRLPAADSSEDPLVQSFHEAQASYQKSLVAETDARKEWELSATQADVVRGAVEVAEAEIAANTALGRVPPPELRSAIERLRIEGRRQEERRVKAEQELVSARATVAQTRTAAVQRLIALPPFSTAAAVDLRDKVTQTTMNPSVGPPVRATTAPIAATCLRRSNPMSNDPFVAIPFGNSCNRPTQAFVCVQHQDGVFQLLSQTVPARDTASIVMNRKAFMESRKWTWGEGASPPCS